MAFVKTPFPSQIPRWMGLAFGEVGGTRGKGFISPTGRGLLPRVPLAKPAGTLGLPFGALPAPRAKPVEPHPTPHAFFAFGSNAPNPLAGDGAVLRM